MKKLCIIMLCLSFPAYAEIPLFKYFPSLQKNVPRIPLLNKATPVHPLTKLETHLLGFSNKRLWVKRDDQSNQFLGGNKSRKLEFLLGRARAEGKKTLFTSGMYGSNHALATALAGKRLGFDVILNLGPQPVTENVKQKLLTFHTLGAQMLFHSTTAGYALTLFKYRNLARFDSSQKMLYVPVGGSSLRGNLGYVNAFFELVTQMKSSGMPKKIVVPLGSGGTVTGLLVGSCLARAFGQTQIVAVGVSSNLVSNRNTIKRDATRLHQFIAKNLSEADRRKLPHCDYGSHDALGFTGSYIDPGYGKAHDGVYQNIDLVKKLEKIHLDSTYSGKAMTYFIDSIKKLRKSEGQPTYRTLFWLTYNSYDLNQVINRYSWSNPMQKWKDLSKDFWPLFEDNSKE